jgi:Fe-S cluster assembly iron-binding protein IscA
MIDVTASAMEELKAIKEKGKVSCFDEFKEVAYGADESDVALRLVPTQTGHLALILDIYRKGDSVVEHEGNKVLLIDAELIDFVDGLKFDCIETPEGRRLEISTPEK